MGGQGVVPPPLSWSLRSRDVREAAGTATEPSPAGREAHGDHEKLRSFELRWVTAVLGDTSVL